MELTPKVKHITILGAGFGGLTAALRLSKAVKQKGLAKNCRITLVNKTSYQVYTPALYEIASIPKGEANAICLKTSIGIDLEDIASRNGFQFVGGEVDGLEREKKLVKFASGEVTPFDYLIIALGAETNYFDISGLKEHSFPLKTFEDALRLRNKTEEVILSGKSPIHIIVGGGGSTGVELTAEFNNFVCYLKERLSGKEKICNAYISLIEAATDILPGFDSRVIKKARRRLMRLGVKILTNKTIGAVDADKVIFKDGSTLPYHIFAWAGGVIPASTIKNFNLSLSVKGRIAVNEYLEAAPGIYAVGDNTEFVHPVTGKPLPGNVPVAETQAKVAAENIVADIVGRKKRRYVPREKYPYILAVGRKYAIADLVLLRFAGFLGWFLKQLVELRYLIFVLGPKKALRMWWMSFKYAMSND